jgi:cold shock protein
MEGTVKFFNRKKGFGFITGDDGKDYFVHVSALAEGTFLRDNDRVSFDSGEGERGSKAENVQLLEKASEREGGEAPTEESNEEPEEEETPAEETSEEPEEEETPAEESSEEPEEEEETPAEETSEEPEEEETPAEESSEEPEEEEKQAE